MKPIMNEQCLPGLLAIFYKNSILAAPRPSHLALRLYHLAPRLYHLVRSLRWLGMTHEDSRDPLAYAYI